MQKKLMSELAKEYAKTFREDALKEIASWAETAEVALTNEANNLPITQSEKRFILRSDAKRFNELFYAIHNILP